MRIYCPDCKELVQCDILQSQPTTFTGYLGDFFFQAIIKCPCGFIYDKTHKGKDFAWIETKVIHELKRSNR